VRAHRSWQHAVKRSEFKLELMAERSRKKTASKRIHANRITLLNREAGLLTFLIVKTFVNVR